MSKLKAISVIFALVVLICCISTVAAAEVDNGDSIDQTDSPNLSECSHLYSPHYFPVFHSSDNIDAKVFTPGPRYGDPFPYYSPILPSPVDRHTPIWVTL